MGFSSQTWGGIQLQVTSFLLGLTQVFKTLLEITIVFMDSDNTLHFLCEERLQENSLFCPITFCCSIAKRTLQGWAPKMCVLDVIEKLPPKLTIVVGKTCFVASFTIFINFLMTSSRATINHEAWIDSK